MSSVEWRYCCWWLCCSVERRCRRLELGPRSFLWVGVVRPRADRFGGGGFVVDGRLPVGTTRAHGGTTILVVEMDAGTAVGSN